MYSPFMHFPSFLLVKPNRGLVPFFVYLLTRLSVDTIPFHLLRSRIHIILQLQEYDSWISERCSYFSS